MNNEIKSENKLYAIVYKTNGGSLRKYELGRNPKEAQERFREKFPNEILEVIHIGKYGNTNCKICEELNVFLEEI